MDANENSSNSTSKTQTSASDLEAAIDKLKGNDRVGTAGQFGGMAAGAAGGAAAAGIAASAAGASTILGSGALGSMLGGVFVAATPVGWVVGCAIAGAAGAYGISKVIKSGGRNDRLREELRDRLSDKLRTTKLEGEQQQVVSELFECLAKAVESGAMPEEQANRMIDLVKSGKLDAKLALERVRGLINVQPTSPEVNPSGDGLDPKIIEEERQSVGNGMNNIADTASRGMKRTSEAITGIAGQASQTVGKIIDSNPDAIKSIKSAANSVSENASKGADLVGKALGSSTMKLGKFFKNAIGDKPKDPR